MALEIRDEDFDAFFDVPFRVYGRRSPYVSPLRTDLRAALDIASNPLWGSVGRGARRVLTVHRDGLPVGRLVAHVHGASNVRHGWTRAFFGLFDAADDRDAAAALFHEADAFARANGCTTLIGNFNLTAMQQMGVVTAGFENVPYSDMVWNPPHIPRLLGELGFTATFPATTFELALPMPDRSALLHGAARDRLADSGLEWVPVRRSRLADALEEVRTVLNDGFADNPMFVPLTAAEMAFQARDLSHVIDPAITALVRDRAGPVGAVLCIPDLNPMLRAMRSRIGWTAPWHLLRQRFRRDGAVIVFYSVAQRFHGRGLTPAMLHRVITALEARGYGRLGLTWIADSNTASLRQVERLGARPLHRVHLFERPVA